MKESDEIGTALADTLLVALVARYRESLARTDAEGLIPEYANAIRAFGRMSQEDQKAFVDFIQLAVCDSASTVLSVLGGGGRLDGVEGDFQILCNGQPVDGIQEAFLIAAEDIHGMRA